MLVLILGIVVFLGIHSFATIRTARARLIERIGLNPYKGLFSLVAAIGLALIVWGFMRYRAAGMIVIWEPPAWTHHVTVALMWFAFVSLAASHAKSGEIKGWLRHPMLVAVKTWALAHLLANGDLGGMILFGAFLLWGGYDRIAVKRRGDMGAPRGTPYARSDVIVLVAGTVAWIAMMFAHPYLIGVAVAPWSRYVGPQYK